MESTGWVVFGQSAIGGKKRTMGDGALGFTCKSTWLINIPVGPRPTKGNLSHVENHLSWFANQWSSCACQTF